MRWPAASDYLIVFGAGLLVVACGKAKGSVAQPLAFNHRVHAGDYQIGCTMCHAYAEHSPVAGVPSMANCAGCHRFVNRDKPEIQRVVELYENGRRIDWIRVDRLPDHVRFTHQRHVLTGVACQTCHGPVERMASVRPLPRQDMAWCLACHRDRRASLDCLACHK